MLCPLLRFQFHIVLRVEDPQFWMRDCALNINAESFLLEYDEFYEVMRYWTNLDWRNGEKKQKRDHASLRLPRVSKNFVTS
jgi:hypothetical protein